MGLGEVWALFPESSTQLEGAAAARVVEGKTVAIDAAIWIVEAITQAHLRAHFDSKSAVLKVFFDRLVRWLTLAGATPVVCLEGDARGTRAGRKSQRSVQFKRRCEDVKKLCAALGVPCIQASGEAEALCAALASYGLVDAVATRDSDVLPFGCSFTTQHQPQKQRSHLFPGSNNSRSSWSSSSSSSSGRTERSSSRDTSIGSSGGITTTTARISTKELLPRPRIGSLSTGSALVFKQLHIDVNVAKSRAFVLDVDHLQRVHGIGPEALIGLFALIGNEYDGREEDEKEKNKAIAKGKGKGKGGKGKGGRKGRSANEAAVLDEIEDNAATLDDDGASSSQSKSGHKSSSSGMARAIGGKGGLQAIRGLVRVWKKSQQQQSTRSDDNSSDDGFLDFMIREVRAAERRKVNGDASHSGDRGGRTDNNSGGDGVGDVYNLLSDEEDEHLGATFPSSTSSVVPVAVSLEDADVRQNGSKSSTTGVHAILWTAQGQHCASQPSSSSTSMQPEGTAAEATEDRIRVPLLDLTRCRGCKRCGHGSFRTQRSAHATSEGCRGCGTGNGQSCLARSCFLAPDDYTGRASTTNRSIGTGSSCSDNQLLRFRPLCECVYCLTVSTHFNGSESDFQDHRSLLRGLAAIEPLPTCSGNDSTPHESARRGGDQDNGDGNGDYDSQETESGECDGLFHRRLMRTIEGYRRPVEPAILAFLNAGSEATGTTRGHNRTGSSVVRANSSRRGPCASSTSSSGGGSDGEGSLPRKWAWKWPGDTSAAIALLEDVYEGESVSRRLLPLQLEWSLRSLVEHCPLLTANSLGSLDQLRDPLTTTFAAPPSVTQSEATESAGAAVAAITTWARAQPHLHITHVPIGIDKLDLRSCETSGTSSSSARTSGIRDENGGAVIGTSVGDGDDTNGDRNDDHDSSVPSSMLSSSPSTHAGAPMRALVAWGALTPDETTTTAGASSGKDGGDNDEDDDDDEEGNNNGAADVAPAEAMVEAATTGAEDSLALTVVRTKAAADRSTRTNLLCNCGGHWGAPLRNYSNSNHGAPISNNSGGNNRSSTSGRADNLPMSAATTKRIFAAANRNLFGQLSPESMLSASRGTAGANVGTTEERSGRGCKGGKGGKGGKGKGQGRAHSSNGSSSASSASGGVSSSSQVGAAAAADDNNNEDDARVVAEFLQTQRDVYERLLCFLPLDLDDFQRRLRLQGGVKFLKPRLKALLSAQGASFMSKATAKSYQLPIAAASDADGAGTGSGENDSVGLGIEAGVVAAAAAGSATSSNSSSKVEEMPAVDVSGQNEVFEVDSDSSSSSDHGNDEHFDANEHYYYGGHDSDNDGIEYHTDYYDEDDDYLQRFNDNEDFNEDKNGAGSIGDTGGRLGEREESAGDLERTAGTEEEEDVEEVDRNEDNNEDDNDEDSSSFIDLTSPSNHHGTFEQRQEREQRTPSLRTSPTAVMTSPYPMMTSPFQSPQPSAPRPTPLSSSSPGVVEVLDNSSSHYDCDSGRGGDERGNGANKEGLNENNTRRHLFRPHPSNESAVDNDHGHRSSTGSCLGPNGSGASGGSGGSSSSSSSCRSNEGSSSNSDVNNTAITKNSRRSPLTLNDSDERSPAHRRSRLVSPSLEVTAFETTAKTTTADICTSPVAMPASSPAACLALSSTPQRPMPLPMTSVHERASASDEADEEASIVEDMNSSGRTSASLHVPSLMQTPSPVPQNRATLHEAPFSVVCISDSDDD